MMGYLNSTVEMNAMIPTWTHDVNESNNASIFGPVLGSSWVEARVGRSFSISTFESEMILLALVFERE